MTTLANPVAAQNYSLPDMGDPSGTRISPGKEFEIGQGVVQQFRRRNLIIDDITIQAYIDDLGYRLVSHSDFASNRFTFFVVRSNSINAFALPGGFIGINAGLIAASRSESELAAVVAHEIVHVTQRHILRSVDKGARAGALSTAALIVGLILSQGNPEVIQAVLGVTQAAAVQNQLNFTRAHELEADRLGIRLLSRAGFDPYAMARFFQLLGQRSRLADQVVPEILRSHPLSSTRITEALNRAAELPRVRNVDSPQYDVVRSILVTAGSDQRAKQLLALYQKQAKLAPPAEKDKILYRQALALRQLERYREASKLLQGLVQRNQTRINYWISLAENQISAKQDRAGLKTYRQAQRLFPENRALTVSHARSLMQLGKPKQARALLQSAIAYEHRGYPLYYGLLARAATESNDQAMGHYYMGEFLLQNGRIGAAVIQLELALDSKKLPRNERLRAQARLEDVDPRYRKGKRR